MLSYTFSQNRPSRVINSPYKVNDPLQILVSLTEATQTKLNIQFTYKWLQLWHIRHCIKYSFKLLFHPKNNVHLKKLVCVTFKVKSTKDRIEKLQLYLHRV